MPHVASDPKAPSIHHSRAPSARPGRANEGASGTPFESLLDDNAAGPAERTPAPKAKPADAASRPERTQKKSADASKGKTPEKAHDHAPAEDAKTAEANARQTAETKGDGKIQKSAVKSTPVQVVEADPTAQSTPQQAPQAGAVIEVKAGTDGKVAAKSAEQAAAGEAAKLAEDDKPVQDPAQGSPVQDSKDAKADKNDTTDGTETDAAPIRADLPAAAAVPVAATPAPQAGTADAPKTVPAQQVAALVAGAPKATGKSATTDPASKADKATKQAAAGETSPDQTAAPAPKDAGPQPATPEAAKKADAQARNTPPAHAQGKPDIAATPQAGAHDAAPKPDAAQTATLPAPTQQTSAASAPAPAAPTAQPAPQAAAVPLAGIAVEIAGKALAGKNHFAIRLDPPELGRIEVRLDVDRDGRVTSHLVADRRDTLDLLQRDSATLQRALQDAGLKTSDNGLQFSLRDQYSNSQPDRPAADSTRIVIEDDTLPAIKAVQTAQSRYAARRGGIDIRI